MPVGAYHQKGMLKGNTDTGAWTLPVTTTGKQRDCSIAPDAVCRQQNRCPEKGYCRTDADVPLGGITEAHGADGKMFGEDRLIKIVESYGGKSAAEIHAAILEGLKPYEKSDDVTLLVMKRV